MNAEPTPRTLPCPKCGAALRMETLLGTSRNVLDCLDAAIADITERIEYWRTERANDSASLAIAGNLDWALSRVEDIAAALNDTTVRFMDAHATPSEP